MSFQSEFERGDPHGIVAAVAARIREHIDATWPATPEERLDEELMGSWAGWREASCITNEAFHGSYAAAGRFQLAEDLRNKESRSR